MAQISPVAIIHTPFSTKFGIPRQSGLVDAPGRIVLEKPYRSPEILRGIEGYSHLWLIWGFSEANYTGGATVRPPRLGGNTRMGIFATRSPFRPNGLGLSCVELVGVDHQALEGPVLLIKGADMLDGTPIFDIKPYLPFADSIPDAKGGFADALKEERMDVTFVCDTAALPIDTLAELRAILENDPRPHYQDDPAREYAFEYAGYRIVFSCEGKKLFAKEISPI